MINQMVEIGPRHLGLVLGSRLTIPFQRLSSATSCSSHHEHERRVTVLRDCERPLRPTALPRVHPSWLRMVASLPHPPRQRTLPVFALVHQLYRSLESVLGRPLQLRDSFTRIVNAVQPCRELPPAINKHLRVRRQHLRDRFGGIRV